MAHEEIHQITLVKPAQRQLRDKVIQNNLTAMIASVNNKSLAVRGWSMDQGTPAWSQTIAATEDAEYVYEMYLALSFERADGKKPGTNELASIVRTLFTRSQQPAFGKWMVAAVDGKPYTAPDDDDISSNINADLIGYTDVEIPADWDSNFDHLFGLDSHIARVRMALEEIGRAHV